MKSYNKTDITELFSIDKIVTIIYYEFANGFKGPSEKHDFWEFVYVDKGEMKILLDGTPHIAREGQLIFYSPNVSHGGGVNNVASNVGIVSFECHSAAMEVFKNRVITLNAEEKELVSKIISKGAACFEPMRDEVYKGMKLKENVTPYSLQTIKIWLELLLIKLGESETVDESFKKTLRTNQENYNDDIANEIAVYLKENMRENITLDQISEHLCLSKSYIKIIFKNKYNCGVIDYLINLKISEAKRLIRETSMNFTQIADTLGFSSVHYFSKIFKQRTRMTPSQYGKSILGK